MWLKKLKLQNIRAYTYAIAHVSPGINVFFGRNGEGKTSLLEAAHLLGTLKSFKTTKNKEAIRNGEQRAQVSGEFEGPNAELCFAWHERGREMKKNENKVADIREFVKDLRIVALAPEHQQLISGPMEERRKYLDRTLFALNPSFLETAQNYSRALKQKQALLREQLPWAVYEDQVAPWNEELVKLGTLIRQLRKNLTQELSAQIKEKQKEIVPQKQSVEIDYLFSDQPLSEEQEEKKRVEHAAERALVGPHKDRLQILFNNRPLEEVGSQGERSTLLLSLKLAELEHIQQKTHQTPILLLDDLGATLDAERQGQLLGLLKNMENQVLVTTADDRVVGRAKEVGGVVKVKKTEELEGGFYVANWGVA